MNDSRALVNGELSTYSLQEADILTERSNTAAEGEQEHEHAHHNEQDGGVHSQAGQGCFWERGFGSVPPGTD